MTRKSIALASALSLLTGACGAGGGAIGGDMRSVSVMASGGGETPEGTLELSLVARGGDREPEGFILVALRAPSGGESLAVASVTCLSAQGSDVRAAGLVVATSDGVRFPAGRDVYARARGARVAEVAFGDGMRAPGCGDRDFPAAYALRSTEPGDEATPAPSLRDRRPGGEGPEGGAAALSE
ncbi:MAG TPA: hypothetical protein VH880_06220 [Anaeromyxobacteraceae bacterium]|jgi:hypothetical protein